MGVHGLSLLILVLLLPYNTVVLWIATIRLPTLCQAHVLYHKKEEHVLIIYSL